jgi:cell division transport system permease protein
LGLWIIGLSLKEALSNIWRNPRSSLGAIVSLSLLLFLTGATAWGWLKFEELSASWRAKARLVVYLRDDATQAQKKTIAERLSLMPEVQRVQYISKAEAWRRLSQSLDGPSELMDGLEENPLPASFEVTLKPKARHVAVFDQVASSLGGLPGIEEIDYGRKWLEKLEDISRRGRLAALAGLLLVTVSLVLIIHHTVRLTLQNRIEELEVMKLVGASPSFIQGPYILEGAIKGLAGSILAAGALGVLFRALKAWIGKTEPLVLGPWGLGEPTALVLAGVVIAGLGLGTLASGRAVREVERRLP